MAFGLSGFYAYGQDASEAVTAQAIQNVVFKITGTASDVDMDIGELTLASSVFWTDVANPTVYAIWKAIIGDCAKLENVFSYELLKNFVQAGGGAIGAGKVKYNGTALAVEILMNAGEGLTAYTVTFQYLLQSEARVTKYSYGNVWA